MAVATLPRQTWTAASAVHALEVALPQLLHGGVAALHARRHEPALVALHQLALHHTT